MAKKAKDDEEPTPGVNPQAVYIGGESIADRIVPHIKKILVGAVIFAVVVGGFFAYRAWTKGKKEKATASVIAALHEMRRDIEEEPDPESTDVTYPSRKDRAEAVLATLGKAKGGARDAVALFEADMLLEAGRLDEAEAAFGKVAKKAGIEGVLAREGLAFIAESRGDHQAALDGFRAMQPDEAGPRRAYALYHEARMLAQLGKKDEARTQFDAALTKANETDEKPLAAMIEARLVQLVAAPIAFGEPDPEAPEAPEVPDAPDAPAEKPDPEAPPQ
jgi:predicted negative regulator of RcsB-dependent stress response